jgi:hypothetical protein
MFPGKNSPIYVYACMYACMYLGICIYLAYI